MSSRVVRFPGTQGVDLAARLDLPDAGTARAFAIFAHCFTCSKDSKAASLVSQALAARGIATLRFDFTGLGESQGEFAATTFTSNVGDLLAAVQWLRDHHAAPQVLIGHSLGGAAVLAAARDVPEARAVATLGAPFEPAHVAHLLGDARAQIESAGEADVSIGGRPFRLRRRFLDDLARHDPLATIATLRKALLVMHSPLDTVVDIDNAARIFVAAKHPKSFVSLDRADHLITRREDAAYVAEVISAWASRFLDATTEPAAQAVTGVRVVETGVGRFQQSVTMGRHTLVADEPVAVGGDDTGPSPYDLLLAALGTCTAMTLRMYARQKQWPLERVSVELQHAKVHAADCDECETREGRIDRIERVIRLEGTLDDTQRTRLMEIADKCPVHRTLHSEVWIPTRLGQ